MNRQIRWKISAGAILLFALMYFFDGSGLVSALLPAVLVHELAHALALQLCGCRLTRVSVSVFGAEMDYAPQINGLRAILCFLSGPLAGMVYAVAACTIGGNYLRMSGSASFVLSAFNCLPILPLDGGRVVQTILPAAQARRISRFASLLLLACGMMLAVYASSFGMLLMGAWLSVCNYRTAGNE